MIFSTRVVVLRNLLLQPVKSSLIRHPSPTSTNASIATSTKTYFSTTAPLSALKPGTPIPGLEGIYPKAKDPSQPSKVPSAKPRNEYPAWVFELGKPLPTLAKLKSMDIADASDADMKRYLKLTRRARIKANNTERAKS